MNNKLEWKNEIPIISSSITVIVLERVPVVSKWTLYKEIKAWKKKAYYTPHMTRQQVDTEKL